MFEYRNPCFLCSARWNCLPLMRVQKKTAFVDLQNNAVQFTLTFIMAIGWITLCVLPLHILRTTKARQDSEQQSKQHQSVKKGITALASDWKDGEVHEQRHIGRPNFDRCMVYCMVPQNCKQTHSYASEVCSIKNHRPRYIKVFSFICSVSFKA